MEVPKVRAAWACFVLVESREAVKGWFLVMVKGGLNRGFWLDKLFVCLFGWNSGVEQCGVSLFCWGGFVWFC